MCFCETMILTSVEIKELIVKVSKLEFLASCVGLRTNLREFRTQNSEFRMLKTTVVHFAKILDDVSFFLPKDDE